MIRRVQMLFLHPLFWFAVALTVLPFFVVFSGGSLVLATEIACFALLALAYNILLGQTGLLSFGHGLFFGAGAYVAALVQLQVWEDSMLGALTLGAVVAGALGLAVGALILRKSSGVYFSLITLAFGMGAFYLVYRATSLTGGENGLGGFEPQSIAGIDMVNRANFYYFTALVVFVGAASIWRLSRSPFGMVLRGIKGNEERVRALGYNPYRYKVVAFTVSAFFSGLAGALYVYALAYTFPTLFHATFSGQITAMTILGGTGPFLGPALGGFFFVYVREALSSVTENWMFFFGLLFVAFIVFSPQGVSGVVQGWVRRWRRGKGADTETASAVDALSAEPNERRPQFEATNPVARPTPAGPVLLKAEGVVKCFDGFTAVDAVDLEVQEGAIHGLIGPNGAGKTTFFNCLSGALAETSGRVVFDGREITNAPMHDIARQGMARSFQIVSVFKELTVAENLRIAVQAVTKHRAQVHTRAAAMMEINRRAEELAAEMGLQDKKDVVAEVLSHGDLRLLDIGMALAADPKLLLLDEPFAGLPSSGRDAVTDVVRHLNRERGMTILLIEHDIERLMALADIVTVLQNGQLLAEGAPDEVRNDPEVQRAYMGNAEVTEVARQELTDRPVLLEMNEVDAFYDKSQALEKVSLRVHEGEVVSLLGRNGAGKTTTLMSIMGGVTVRHGTISFAGHDITNAAPEHISRSGIGLVPQGRRVFGNLTVDENLKLAARESPDDGWTIERAYQRFPMLDRLKDRPAGNLSGGERQMLAMARALVGNTRLVLLDEPFEGLAQIVVSDIVDVIRDLRGELTILLVEQSFELAVSLADRTYVISNGQIVFDGDPSALAGDRQLSQRLMGV